MADLSDIQPLFDYVLIKPLEGEEKTAAGIYLPDSVKEKPQIGLVMAIGPGAIDDKGKVIKMQVKKSQKVVYKKWGGNEVKIKGQELLLVEQKDILAIVK